ncbi:MAG: hypothetical protein KAH30_02135, partial [Caldisericia bacterium]|nr:hypothetical protein [Caldisericia bacterium]
MKPNRSNYEDHEDYEEACDDHGDAKYEQERDRRMEESIHQDHLKAEILDRTGFDPEQIIALITDQEQILTKGMSLESIIE